MSAGVARHASTRPRRAVSSSRLCRSEPARASVAWPAPPPSSRWVACARTASALPAPRPTRLPALSTRLLLAASAERRPSSACSLSRLADSRRSRSARRERSEALSAEPAAPRSFEHLLLRQSKESPGARCDLGCSKYSSRGWLSNSKPLPGRARQAFLSAHPRPSAYSFTELQLSESDPGNSRSLSSSWARNRFRLKCMAPRQSTCTVDLQTA
mmetsp:Transcript_76759/g.212067  ORF Transcript_76759/g.212067 Transcript_76759/m.212067 type:complete len:214 (+) Transcript_76759:497-1138(+)